MSRVYRFEQAIQPDWIDYNGHMRDSYFGLIFSLAVDALQDEVGFDEAYRKRTGCTIFLLEDHKFFLREFKQGDLARVETRVLGSDEKRFHLHMQMFNGDALAAVGEYMEIHVNQHPKPHACPMPAEIHAKLKQAVPSETEIGQLGHRSRALGL